MFLQAEDPAIVCPYPLKHPVTVEETVIEDRDLGLLFGIEFPVNIDQHEMSVISPGIFYLPVCREDFSSPLPVDHGSIQSFMKAGDLFQAALRQLARKCKSIPIELTGWRCV
ncbi:MAG: hypothetical protein A4E38_00051 [Methanoregulaceae archaeon PtaB.Bin108]|nr:MAG: hypothetical protein A4E38_00051 [Methanoregulaceae archaeon PtaB.Bin108]